jgi:hypothetical protein
MQKEAKVMTKSRRLCRSPFDYSCSHLRTIIHHAVGELPLGVRSPPFSGMAPHRFAGKPSSCGGAVVALAAVVVPSLQQDESERFLLLLRDRGGWGCAARELAAPSVPGDGDFWLCCDQSTRSGHKGECGRAPSDSTTSPCIAVDVDDFGRTIRFFSDPCVVFCGVVFQEFTLRKGIFGKDLGKRGTPLAEKPV